MGSAALVMATIYAVIAQMLLSFHGRHTIELRFVDPTLRTRRMDSGFYQRAVILPETDS